MNAAPRYYYDLRDMLGNIYDQSGLGLKLVPYTINPDGTIAANSPSNIGIVLVKEPNFGLFVCDIISSNMYDLYLHRPDRGYVLLQSQLWLTGADIDDRLLEKKALRVGGGSPVIYAGDYDQVIAFDIRNWDGSVRVTSGDNKTRVISYQYDPSHGAITVVLRPTLYTAQRERARFLFIKQSTKELREAYAYVI